MRYAIQNLSLIVPAVCMLIGCNGSSSNNDAVPTEEVADVRDWWDLDAPNYIESLERPSIALTGESVILLQLGEQFSDEGAIASDAEDGDLTAQITVEGLVDTENVGDYFLRYSVTDSDGNYAIDQTRLIRVIEGDETVDFSLRELGNFQVNLGYVEYLPPNYGKDLQEKHPLIIYHHGNGANAEFTLNGQTDALDSVLSNFGPPTLMRAGRWDKELPFIVLMPQAGTIQGSDPAERVDVFVQHALLTYDIDPSRIYMMGWSQGGSVTMNYARRFPEKLAAIISISAGSPFVDDLPDDFCNAENIPLWIFHGGLDEVVLVDNSIRLYEQTIGDCQPQILPKFTLYSSEYHGVHHFTADLSAMAGARFEYETDSNYDPFDVSIYDWLLSFNNER